MRDIMKSVRPYKIELAGRQLNGQEVYNVILRKKLLKSFLGYENAEKFVNAHRVEVLAEKLLNPKKVAKDLAELHLSFSNSEMYV
jgi:hypothetical protein